MGHQLTKADLEYYATAKPRTRTEVGYFTSDGKLVRGPFYSACIGKKIVGFKFGMYIEEAGMYRLRADALWGAKLFQEKARKLLANGEFTENK